MTLQLLQKKVVEEFDRRQLKSEVRYRALNKIIDFLISKYGNDANILSKGKEILKKAYEQYKGKELNGAEKGAFNELFNQYSSCSL